MHLPSLLHRTEEDQIYSGICEPLTQDTQYQLCFRLSQYMILCQNCTYFLLSVQTALILMKACWPSTGNPIIRLISSLIYTARYHQMVLAPSRKKRSVFTWLDLFEKGQTLLGFVCPFALNIPANDRGVHFPTSLS